MSTRRLPNVSGFLALLIALGIAFSMGTTPKVIAQSTAVAPTPTTPTDPFAGLSIPELAARSYGGGQITIDQTLTDTPGLTRYLIHYPSDGLTIYGFMDIPTRLPRTGSTYPVIIAIHGYISPSIYQTLDYTTRYADTLARAGYLVVHPNLRGYRPSDAGPNLLRVGFAIDVLNLIAIVRTQGGQPGPLQKASPTAIGLWGHSMGGGVSIRVMTVDSQIQAVVLDAPISGDDQLDAQRWPQRPGQYDRVVPPDVFQRVSPIYFYDRIQAAVSIHQGLADTTVPPAWSADLCAKLQALHKSVECFTYMGQSHSLTGSSDSLFIKRTLAFFAAHLNAN